MSGGSRRNFLKVSLVAAGGLGLGVTAWSRYARKGVMPGPSAALGALKPVKDLTTGLPILNLPDGFRYHSFAWAGDVLGDGYRSPRAADGMDVVSDENGIVTLIRNHELRGSSGAIGDPDKSWDNTGGGTTTLRFDTRKEQLVGSNISLGGTCNNCAGGATPWGTYLSCEEGVVTPDRMHMGIETRQLLWGHENARKPHGYVFEVTPEGESDPQPIVEMGQFYHEAAAFDPATGHVYMTEDHAPHAGLYRFIPNVREDLKAGGKLQMLKVEGFATMVDSIPLYQTAETSWVDIKEPGRGHTPGKHDGVGVVTQGMQAGATAFLSLEGCTWHDGSIYFTSKASGDAGAGQIFRLRLAENTVETIFEASERNGFSGMDNIIVSPNGSLMICEDRLGIDRDGQYLAGLDKQGELFAFCQTNPDLTGKYLGFDLRKTAVPAEWAGACFSKDGKWLFANLYSPGMSFAITGPWGDGPV